MRREIKVMWCFAGISHVCFFLVAVHTERVTAAECGIVTPEVRTLIVNGSLSELGAFPWHLGVYKKSRSRYEYICGGTLISPNLVLSAAHCFYDEVGEELYNNSKYMIAGGKYYRDYDVKENYTQKSSVRKISIPGRYVGFSGAFAYDIALVHLDTPFNISALVRPVCIDWTNKYENEQLRSGQTGKVLGWGKTETGKVSDELKEIVLPYIPYEKCSEVVPPAYKPMISPEDKFCAGYYQNGSSVCKGDSGGGLCFESKEGWYLRGVVSTIPAGSVDLECNQNMYATFTRVRNHLDWIQAAYDCNGTRKISGCVLPPYPANGFYRVFCENYPCTLDSDVGVREFTVITYGCRMDYSLQGDSTGVCHDSSWGFQRPSCVKIEKSKILFYLTLSAGALVCLAITIVIVVAVWRLCCRDGCRSTSQTMIYEK